MNTRPTHPFIPAEALARKARLSAALEAMEAVAPSAEPACLQELRGLLSGIAPKGVEPLLTAIMAGDLAEEASDILRTCRRDGVDRALIENMIAAMKPLAEKAYLRRSTLWQLDTRRALIRFSYAKETGAIGFDDGDLHAIFLQAFRLEGIPLALDLAKRPRPMLSAGLPLPAGVASLVESMDVVLKQEPRDDQASLTARLNRRLPEGLRIHGWNALPHYASTVSDLALMAQWRWEMSPDQHAAMAPRVSSFLAVEHWLWRRGTAKHDATLDARAIVEGMSWEADALVCSTRLGAFQAINPLKLLGAIFDLDPAAISGLTRVGIELKPDPRLGQAGRFEPKLKNMYEDAVLLGDGSNITIVDEDDDEPIHLG